MFNLLIGCDQNYYDLWGKELLKSVYKHNPWLELHCHIVNPRNLSELAFVDYTTENKTFKTQEEEKYYLQVCRFIALSNKFEKSDLVVTVDTDSICTQSVSVDSFAKLFSGINILHHPKDNRWLAGFISFPDNDFRYKLVDKIMEIPLNKWQFKDRIGGRDQQALMALADQYNYVPLDRHWMSIGKNKPNSVFLTLKGSQKTTTKYLGWYNKYRN